METELVVIIVLILGYPLSFLYLRKRWLRYKSSMEKEYESEKFSIEKECMSKVLNKQMQYQALQSQINPHFLYNTLDSIRGEALIVGNDSVAVMTERLSKFFRYCISNKGNIATIRDEINNILDYFFIQEYRFGDKFHLVTEVEEGCDQYKLPKMTLQPIVENAIFHGLERKKDGGTVSIKVFETEKNIKIQVSDNGMGIEEEILNKINENLRRTEEEGVKEEPGGSYEKTGIALQNVNDRIKLHYGSDYGIVVHSTKYLGTDVMVLIPKVIEHE